MEALEQRLRQRHGNEPDFRLSDYFDLIAGTSTGAITAACLALGMSAGEVLEKFQKLGRNVFSRDWSNGADNLLLVSVGTGRSDPSNDNTSLAAAGAITALMSLMNDCGNLVETMIQLLSSSATSRVIVSQCGDLGGDVLAGKPTLTYINCDMALTKENAISAWPELALYLWGTTRQYPCNG